MISVETLSTFWELVKFIVVLSFLVIIHELGHYLTAKYFKVKVHEFGLGYPPRAMKLFRHKGTLFSLNWIPFGGFVQMEGEEGPESTEEVQQETQHVASKKTKKASASHPEGEKEGPFYSKSIFARLVIILSGATINFVFGVVAFSIFFSWQGIPVLTDRARIGIVAEGSPAAQSKLPVGVEVMGIKDAAGFVPTPTVQAAIEHIAEQQGKKITIVTTGQCVELSCEEKVQEFEVYVRTKEEIPVGQGALGIQFEPVVEQRFYPWYEMPVRGAWFGVQQAFFLSKLILESLGQMGVKIAQGDVPQEVGSPIRIFREGRQAGIFSRGNAVLLNFAGIISINLAIFNVLPIPALDGGRAVLILLEKIIGKHRVEQFEGSVNYAGLVFLVALMIGVFAKDIFELF